MLFCSAYCSLPCCVNKSYLSFLYLSVTKKFVSRNIIILFVLFKMEQKHWILDNKETEINYFSCVITVDVLPSVSTSTLLGTAVINLVKISTNSGRRNKYLILWPLIHGSQALWSIHGVGSLCCVYCKFSSTKNNNMEKLNEINSIFGKCGSIFSKHLTIKNEVKCCK